MSQVADCILLEENLKRLRLPTVLRHYSESARQARESGDKVSSLLNGETYSTRRATFDCVKAGGMS